MSGLVVMSAGDTNLVRRTYPAALVACLAARLNLVVVSWSPFATNSLKRMGCAPIEATGATLTEAVTLALKDATGIVGRIDEHVLVDRFTMKKLLSELGEDTDAVSAFMWDDPPAPRWESKLTFGGCHLARDPQPFDSYAGWFPRWASEHRVSWVADTGATLVGATRAAQWAPVAATPVAPGVRTLAAGPVIDPLTHDGYTSHPMEGEWVRQYTGFNADHIRAFGSGSATGGGGGGA